MIKNFRARLACRGRIKIGGLGEEKKKRGGNGTYRLPEKYDHFVVTTNERDSAGRLIPDKEVRDIYGERPKILNIILFSNNVGDVYEDSMAYFAGKTCICRGDGETAQWNLKSGQKPDGLEIVDDDNGKLRVICDPGTCPYSGTDEAEAVRCKPNAILRVLIQEAQAVGAVYEFRTTSWNTIRSLRASVEILSKVTSGHLAGIPLQLKISPKTTQTQKGDSRIIYVVHIEYPGSIWDLKKLAHEMQCRSIAYDHKLVTLASGYEESPEEIEEIVAEYYPEAGPAAKDLEEGQGVSGDSKSLEDDTGASLDEEGPEDNDAQDSKGRYPEAEIKIASPGQKKMIHSRKEKKGIPDEDYLRQLESYGTSNIDKLPRECVNSLLEWIGSWEGKGAPSQAVEKEEDVSPGVPAPSAEDDGAGESFAGLF